MAPVRLAVHTDLRSTSEALGLLAWACGEVAYYSIVDREAATTNLRAAVSACARTVEAVDALTEYLLESGGGGYRGFILVDQLEAASIAEAARFAAHRLRLDLAIAPPRRPRCSRCGSTAELHAVTVHMDGDELPGRLLVYCINCRGSGPGIGASIPLAEFDVRRFVGLYSTGQTASAPRTAAEIVFGEVMLDAVAGAEAAVQARSPR